MQVPPPGWHQPLQQHHDPCAPPPGGPAALQGGPPPPSQSSWQRGSPLPLQPPQQQQQLHPGMPPHVTPPGFVSPGMAQGGGVMAQAQRMPPALMPPGFAAPGSAMGTAHGGPPPGFRPAAADYGASAQAAAPQPLLPQNPACAGAGEPPAWLGALGLMISTHDAPASSADDRQRQDDQRSGAAAAVQQARAMPIPGATKVRNSGWGPSRAGCMWHACGTHQPMHEGLWLPHACAPAATLQQQQAGTA